MFTDFYGMREQPFGVTPDSRYLYLSHTHREALASLYCGIRDHRGFLTLIAPPGTGKTTVLFYLLKRLRAYSRTAFLFDSPSDPEDLMSSLAADTGMNTYGLDNAQIKQQFHRVLLQEASAERTFVIVVDEAQNLSNSVLEKIRLLSNFESGTHKLLQVVLAGQPQLANRLSHPDLVQLRQRIAMTTALEPLSHDQVRSYIQHRLNVAGYSAGSLFTRDALVDIARESAGIPRMINILCYNSLALGCAREQKCIDVSIVRQAASDLALEQGTGDAKQFEVRHLASSRGEFRHSNQNDEVLKANDPIAGHAVGERTNNYLSASKVWTRFGMLAKGSLALAVLLIIIPIGTRPKLSQPAGPTSLKTPIEWKADSSSSISGGNVSAADNTRSDRAPTLTGIRYWSELTTTRVVIDLDERVKYDAYRLAAPDRVYLDLHGSKVSSVLFGKRFEIKDTLLRKIRVAEHAQDMTRVTLETSKPCDYSIAVIPNPTRLSITLWSTGRRTTEASSGDGLSALVSN
jgi:type II secretory pathway predicted ATPase ExeA